MKRSLIIVVAILILLVLAGCIRPQEQEELLIEEFPENEIQFELGLVSGLKSSYKIVVKGELLATVHAWIEDDATLFLRFEASDGWLLLESRAATSTTLTGMPKNKDGKTDPSLFSGEVHNTPLTEYTVALPIGKLSDGQKVYFGTYNEFRKVGTRTRVKYGVCINSFIYHDDNPVIDKKPKLEGDIDDPLVRGFTYDWEIEKSVDPESVELKLGESATLTYTINATRTPVDGDFSLFGAVNLNSTGELPASNISITVMLQYLLGDVYTDLEGFTAINVDTSATPTLNPGESSSYKYDFAFDPKEGVDEYRIRASVTADDIFPFTLDATFTLSGLAESTDATATIADQLKEIESEIPGGFSAAYVPPTTGSWVLEQPGDGIQTFSLVYEVILTNEKIEDPQQDFYILDNTATLIEYNSKAEHSDDARVIITVPQESEDILELTVEVSGEFGWEETVRYGWEIDKSVDPSSAELSIGEEEDFEYTLTATRSVEETTALATITGKATVENTGSLKAEGVSLVITLQYYDGEWKDLQSKGPFDLGDMEVGDSKEEDYEFNFDPTGKSKFRVLATATSGSYSADDDKEFVPGTPEEKYINPSADVEDVFTNFSDFKDNGFSVDPDEEDRSWDDIINHTDWVQVDSNTWKTSYTITVKNEEAEEDLEGYYLYNTVTIYKSGTDDAYDSDDEEVKIIVTELELTVEVSGEFGWEETVRYGWEIDKSVDPSSAELSIGEEEDFEYTLTATRSVEETTALATITGKATVENTGSLKAEGVSLVITLQYYDGEWKDLQSKGPFDLGDMEVGDSKEEDYEFNFDPTGKSKFRVLATATSGSYSADDDKEFVPGTPEEKYINPSADVEDVFTNFSDFKDNGFSVDPDEEDRSWDDIINHTDWVQVDSNTWKTSYTITVKNEEAEEDLEGYYLYNTVTIYKSGTDDAYDSDDEEVKIIVTELELTVEVSGEFGWEETVRYGWEIDKSVDPSSAELSIGEEEDFEYTLTATRSVEETTALATITGKATVENTGSLKAEGVSLVITLQYYDGEWKDLQSKGPFDLGDMEVGDSKEEDYEFNFDPTGKSKFRVLATATSGSYSADDDKEFVPGTPEEKYINPSADVEDVFTNFSDFKDNGFSVDPDEEDRSWDDIINHTDWVQVDSNTWKTSYTITVKNEEAEEDLEGYYLYNTVTIYKSGTDDAYDSDDEEVKIIVTELELTVEVSGEFGWEETVRYGWEIDKSVDPSSAELSIGEEEDFEYTLTATRSVEETTALATITGKATVENTGSLKAEGVSLVITLQYYDGEWKDLQSKGPFDLGDMEVGDSKEEDYEFNFDPTGKSKFRVLATATSGSYSADDDKEFVPGTPEEKYINPSADVEDVFTNFSDFKDNGFSVDPDEEDRSWDDIINHTDWVQVDSNTWKTSYTITVKNEEAEEDLEGYYLYNTVTIYKSGTDDAYDSDDEEVKIIVTELELTVEVSGEFGWEETVRYGWEIDKSVDPSSAELSIGEEEDFEYTLTATRSVEETTALATITGKATVENTGSLKAEGVSLVITLQYYDGEWKDLQSKGPFDLGDMEVGDSKEEDYEFNFDPTGKSKFRVLATATSGSYSADDDKEFVPGTPEEKYINPSADVEDVFTNFSDFKDNGFSVDPDEEDRSWDDIINHTDWVQVDSNTWKTSYTITVKNEEAEEDLEGYYLYNTVTIYKSGTDDAYDSDDEEVKIIVTELELTVEVSGEFGWEETVRYGWEIDKSVDPSSAELSIGEEEDFEYTLTATRSVEETTALATITGKATVENTGSLKAEGVSLVITLQYYDGEWKDLQSKGPFDLGDMEVGDSKEEDYEFNFDPTGKSKFRVLATATSGSYSADDDKEFVPGTPEEKYINPSADVEDVFTNFSDFKDNGFSVDPDEEDRSWDDIINHTDWVQVDSNTWKTSYTITVKNEEAEEDLEGYYLYNTVTIYKSGTDDAYDSDDEEVKIIVTELELTVEVSGEFGWEETVRYGWEIDKSVDPSSAELSIGEEEDFEYTLTATRSVEETTALATITGKATVENTGSLKAEGVSLVITLQYYDGEWKDLQSKGPFDLGDMEVGDSKEEDYEFNFDPTGKSKFRVLATATSGSYSADDDKEFVPGTPEEKYINPSADVEDVFTNFSDFKDNGFSVDPDEEDRSWDDIINHTDWVQVDSNTWKTSYTITVKNEEAEEDLEGYYLYNTVTIYKSGTDDAYDSDDEEVKIIVPETVKLEAEVEAEFFWIREKIYEWEIDKKANPTLITFQVNEFEKDIEYTITATKTLDSVADTHSYSGSVKVTNNGNSEAQNVKLAITLQYYDGSDWIAIQTLPEVEFGSISSGGYNTHGFGPIAFTPVDNTAEHRIKVEVSADAPANTDEAYDYSFLSVTGATETNATAVLYDEFTYVPDGFAIVATDPDPLPFPINLSDSAVVQFSITLRKFSFEGSGSISYKYPGTDLGAYISATVTGYMAGTYPGWCMQVGVSGIEGTYIIQDIYVGGAPDSKMAKVNYILNRYRDGDYPGVDYRHVQIAIWAIMEGSLNWSSWRTKFPSSVPDGDRPLVQAIIDTAEDSFLPGCGDVVLMKALSADKQDVILEIVFPCEEEEFRLENTATLISELQEIWDDAVVEIKLTPTDPEPWGEETAWGGNYEGSGSAWWYYFDTNGPATQDIYAGQNKVAGASVTYKDGKLTIVLGPNMRLQSGSDTVKIQGYAEGELPTKRPEAGHFTYKGTDLIVSVSPARYFAIHLDVEVLQ